MQEVTLYEKFQDRWFAVKRYRRFRVPYVDELEEYHDSTLRGPNSKGVSLAFTNCPGCGKHLSRALINEIHECKANVEQPQERTLLIKEQQKKRVRDFHAAKRLEKKAAKESGNCNLDI